MSTPNQQNGTVPFSDPVLPFHSTPTSTPTHSPYLKRARTVSPTREGPSVSSQQETEIHGDAYMSPADQGRPLLPHGHPQPTNLPTWNAAALLNPKGAVPSNVASRVQGPLNSEANATSNPTNFTFDFASPADQFGVVDSPSADQNGVHTNGMGQNSELNGMGGMIERNFKLQDRSSVPEPKRRKIATADDDADTKQTFRGSGSGILANHIKEKRADGTSGASLKTATVDLTKGGDEDLVIIDKPTNEEVCYGMLEGAQVNCHKLPAPKPGVQALSGPNFWPLVKIVLRRKVGDKTNTIQVYDHTRQVFGKIDPKTSFGLAPLLDIPNLHLRTDARIPTRRKREGEESGVPISQSYNIELMLYGPLKFSRTVGKNLAERGLFLIRPLRVEPGVRVVNPMESKPPSVLASTSSSSSRSMNEAQYSGAPAGVGSRTVEEVRAEVLGVFDSMTKSEDLPELEPDGRILTKLLKHQKQALYFMTNREKPLSEHVNSKLASIWQKKTGHGHQTLWHNIITGQTERQPPAETLGGILADMMGLGKTLSVLSLLCNTMGEAEQHLNYVPVQPRAPEQKKPNSSRQFHPPVPEPLALTRLSKNGRGTLLVCPLSTITNWEEQIKQHVKTGTLSYHIYHGQNRIKDPVVLSHFDLVITTYGSVASELTARTKRKDGRFPLEEIGWFRVVLDEAHMIREPSTLQFKAICRLQAHRRWAVTGTPVQNRLDDLGSLLAFLRLKPFDERTKFIHYIVTPFKVADPEIIPKLRVLVDTITIRRLKDKIDLPPRTDQIVRLEFSPEEQRLYDMFERNAKERVAVLTGQKERLLGGKTYIHILQSILRLRLICAHGKDLLSDEDLQVMHGTSVESAIALDSDDEEDRAALAEDKAYQMFDLMMDTGNDFCINCKRKLGANDAADIESEKQEDIMGYMTPCFHLYCPGCVVQFKDDERQLSHKSNVFGNCPVCNQRVKFSCAELRHSRADAEHENHANAKVSSAKGGKTVKVDGYSGPHTKTRALVEDLLKSKAESQSNPNEAPIKSVVFSGWTSHLDLIEIAFKSVGITYCRLDGKMSRTARTQAMDTFREDDTVHVILVSIMAGGLGLNLTAGSNVYVMEPQYNPAAEAQAVDRVHRLGQKRPVRATRYIMKDSFEEQMLALQNKKIQLANLSMDRAKVIDKAEAAKQRLMDLRSLFK